LDSKEKQKKNDKAIVDIADFNSTCDIQGFITYQIYYDSVKGIVKVKNHNNQKELTFEDKKPHMDVKYATISCWKSPVAFENIWVW